MSDIFISYSKSDVDRARPLVERLEAEGWSVFWDRNLPPGVQWNEFLEAELATAGCVLVLWSMNSITSEPVKKEAEIGRARNVLLPARIDSIRPPKGFENEHACDLSDWDGNTDSQPLRVLIEEVAELLGTRLGVSIKLRTLCVVLGRPSRHPNLGAAINLTCKLANRLKEPKELLALTASATGPSDISYEFDWTLVFDTVGMLEHVRRLEREAKLQIPANGSLETGIQLRAPTFADAVSWPEGNYRFQIRGWIDRSRNAALPNLRCDFDAALLYRESSEISRHLEFSDAEWERMRYSDNAYGVPFVFDPSGVRVGPPAV